MTRDLSELLERVREVKGPDREIDADIFIALEIKDQIGRLDRQGGVVGWWPVGKPYESARETPRYTSSLDATIALCSRVLPGRKTFLIIRHGEPSSAGFEDDANHHCATPALALLAAILSALIEKEDGK